MHLDQALARLRDGGRLVAILGKGMNNADYYKYWDKLRKSFNIRANLSIDGSNYKKYGTTYGVQIDGVYGAESVSAAFRRRSFWRSVSSCSVMSTPRCHSATCRLFFLPSLP